ncbi:hypothetical protein BDQ12DRAFT_690157 [Crucibulum laeve]|uniref:Uncharacterized protein n=1 Tax=Crucibulum laeve TaxID=68775 RepID=A0A5C3LN20_9AGAR|nr:hypothetical protein BDQ12DRAFT_690157 [Crucibulum laeve]
MTVPSVIVIITHLVHAHRRLLLEHQTYVCCGVTIRLLNHPVRKRSLFPASRSRRHPASPPRSVISHSFITFIPLR